MNFFITSESFALAVMGEKNPKKMHLNEFLKTILFLIYYAKQYTQNQNVRNVIYRQKMTEIVICDKMRYGDIRQREST